MVEPKEYTPILDFTVFWSASQLALTGQAAEAYDSARLDKVVKSVAPDEGGKPPNGWFYPPTFLLMMLPLGLLSYYQAYLIFILLTLGGYVAVVQRIFRGPDALLCLVAFPGVWVNLLFSQNGFLTAALAGTALINLERRPILAGVFIGILSIKPHLALLFPVALIAISAWRTFFTAVAVAALCLMVSLAALGTDTFMAWWHSMGLARQLLETAGGHGFFTAVPSTFGFLRLSGTSVTTAYIGQAVVALVAMAILWKIWRSCNSRPLRGASFVTATLLTSPYLLIYDLAWLALPIAWLAKLGIEGGWLRGERELLIVVWMLPILTFQIARILPLQIGPLVLLLLLWMLWRRVGVMQEMERIESCNT
ncbi:MAG: DUF2029 domain-containing protein [Ferrovum sp.]|nr:DUF2029 domain-containing protein [Ferrovum sp.]